ncbi:MAG: hypothetical protein MK102_02965 [Fuerstiella sp.]|nr:hypothetical protein [Fuerstiella sp.]
MGEKETHYDAVEAMVKTLQRDDRGIQSAMWHLGVCTGKNLLRAWISGSTFKTNPQVVRLTT